ncbi:hypothetical protein NDU88_005234 [Pleurodeles waltl]|uniref:Uncharacterized protein n=1 Tax=Pleurodeles waltl TaxID=8319 RepID=A0AAV7WXP0_PLEWA|nr:hypothetical protein NDU88_005234 [Pleurodeles waltl]
MRGTQRPGAAAFHMRSRVIHDRALRGHEADTTNPIGGQQYAAHREFNECRAIADTAAPNQRPRHSRHATVCVPRASRYGQLQLQKC